MHFTGDHLLDQQLSKFKTQNLSELIKSIDYILTKRQMLDPKKIFKNYEKITEPTKDHNQNSFNSIFSVINHKDKYNSEQEKTAEQKNELFKVFFIKTILSSQILKDRSQPSEEFQLEPIFKKVHKMLDDKKLSAVTKIDSKTFKPNKLVPKKLDSDNYLTTFEKEYETKELPN